MSSFSIAVEPEAADDLVTAFDWYEEQLVGLGHEFLISVQVSFAQIERNPEIYQKLMNVFAEPASNDFLSVFFTMFALLKFMSLQ